MNAYFGLLKNRIRTTVRHCPSFVGGFFVVIAVFLSVAPAAAQQILTDDEVLDRPRPDLTPRFQSSVDLYAYCKGGQLKDNTRATHRCGSYIYKALKDAGWLEQVFTVRGKQLVPLVCPAYGHTDYYLEHLGKLGASALAEAYIRYWDAEGAAALKQQTPEKSAQIAMAATYPACAEGKGL